MESLLFPPAMSSNSSSLSEEPNSLYSITTTTPPASTTTTARLSSSVLLIHNNFEDFKDSNTPFLPTKFPPPLPQLNNIKKKRSLPGNPDPDAEVIALSPRALLATNRFVCEICNKGFQRDQNLQLHRRGHNLPWKLKKRPCNGSGKDQAVRKRAYVCPEPTCVHHHPSRALGDLTGIKKHYCRKHGEKKWKCDKCDKVYAVQSDWKAHSKTCGTREYRCDCGTLFSRKDSFITHRAFCDALAEESARLILANQQAQLAPSSSSIHHHHLHLIASHHSSPSGHFPVAPENPNPIPNTVPALLPSQYAFPSLSQKCDAQSPSFPTGYHAPPPQLHHLSNQFSATALLQKATAIGATTSTRTPGSLTDHMAQLGVSNLDAVMKVSPEFCLGYGTSGSLGDILMESGRGEITRDFLGLRAEAQRHNADHGGESSSFLVAMKPHGLIQNFGLTADHPAITNASTTSSSRLWG
ncbi:hypothetical protein SAY86_005189 [Trapa natans]|uniref:C2H2-type domain-containing protein n=1 Tax=Trapa natans TaxID=22666 RepID=A0AAN7L0C3_TRANT|nr:hypothetical protein SAY86_005189 [Trapa natans]